MPIGGFNGTDPSPTPEQFQKMVADGKIHYFIAGGRFGGGFFGGGPGGGRASARARRSAPGSPNTSHRRPSTVSPSTT